MSGTIPENLQSVRARIAAAAHRAHRSPNEISLVAVTKQRPLEDIRELIAAGQRIMGENRVNETLEKIAAFTPQTIEPPLDWHFIGHLQTNKARKIAGRCALLHGVDSLHLAQALQEAADNADCKINILLEVNVSGEESKYGISPQELEHIARELRFLDRIKCLGLMTMAPWEAEPEETRQVFRGLRNLMNRLKEQELEHLDLRHLSMGMSNDFEIAIEEGATLVRIGTALFQT